MPLVAIGVVLVVGCALAVAMWTSSASKLVGVLAAARDIPAGSVLVSEDLRVVMVSVESGVPTLAAAQRDELVGAVAAVAVPEGSLLSDAHVNSGSVLNASEALVAVRVAPGDLPSSDLRDGDFVSVVRVSGAEAESVPEALATAKVMRLELLDEVTGGEMSVSLLVPRSTAAEIVDAAAGDEARLVSVSAEQISAGDGNADMSVEGG